MKKLMLSVAALAALLIGSSVAYAHDPYCRPNTYGYGYNRGYGVTGYGLYGNYGALYGPRFNFGYGYNPGVQYYNPGVQYYNNYRPHPTSRCACGQYHPRGYQCGHGGHGHRW